MKLVKLVSETMKLPPGFPVKIGKSIMWGEQPLSLLEEILTPR